jgi:hypothetical protein
LFRVYDLLVLVLVWVPVVAAAVAVVRPKVLMAFEVP